MDFYDVRPGRDQFLMLRVALVDRIPNSERRFILVANWFRELRQRMGN